LRANSFLPINFASIGINTFNKQITMADRLTQIQDCLDQLLTQMYASVKYIDTRHSFTSIPDQPDQFNASDDPSSSSDPPQSTSNQEGELSGEPSGTDPTPDPLFEQRIQELAQDLVIKEQQIEALVATLPGVGSSQAMQEKRLAELQVQLLELDEEAKQWQGEKGVLVERLEDRLEGIMRV
jgi:mediator of RNA polymerase II transcription subunit 21